MPLELPLRLGGLALLGLTLLHLVFPRRFQWKTDLAQLTLLNRQIFYVHTLFLCLVLIWMGLLAVLDPGALLTPSPLARWVNAGTAGFWLARLVIQFFGYSAELWRGKRLETFVHYAFSLLWIGLTVLYTLAWWKVR